MLRHSLEHAHLRLRHGLVFLPKAFKHQFNGPGELTGRKQPYVIDDLVASNVVSIPAMVLLK
ncbi:Acyl transferase domain in polyketide synthase enzyme [Pseudomonas syringae pv. actinidiae]|uniref:Acyl transferase domain in polyketide synthase enzyme n=1 Tax=Pseudomonas syringae pv. actinidiae TaxID=103796 RepID=A0A2V0Q7E9_PSESF|nr:Acyl transferase domain in polyketide synthase enzyme [Pseudomonas syringae pv. actinidiae]